MTTDVGKKLLQRIMEEVEASAPDLFAPNSAVKRSDKKIGIVTSETARKLYAVAQTHRRDEAMGRVEAQFTARDDAEQVNSVRRNVIENEETADVCMALFWMCVREELNHWTAAIGIRKGWLAVIPVDKRSEHPLAFLMGGGEPEEDE